MVKFQEMNLKVSQAAPYYACILDKLTPTRLPPKDCVLEDSDVFDFMRIFHTNNVFPIAFLLDDCALPLLSKGSHYRTTNRQAGLQWSSILTTKVLRRQ